LLSPPRKGKQCETALSGRTAFRFPGAQKLEHLNDNLPAAEVELTPEDLREIDEAFSTIDVKGAPLSEALTLQIDR
jgi:diketogulonate reductase-like aldo/keto reductase